MSERIQLLDDLGAEFARVADEAERTSPKRQPGHRFRSGLRARALAMAVVLAALFATGAYAVPGAREAVGGVADSFADWVSGDNDSAPGRALDPADDVPRWFTEGGEARLIAKTGGVALYVRRVDSDEGPWLWFGLGEGVGRATGDSLERWRQRLGRHAVVVLGPALFGPRDVLDERGRFPLLGVTARDVERVELRYSEGPPLVAHNGDGGFVLLVDAWRRARELVAYDATGRVLDRADLSRPDTRYLCEKEPAVCPPRASSRSR